MTQEPELDIKAVLTAAFRELRKAEERVEAIELHGAPPEIFGPEVDQGVTTAYLQGMVAAESAGLPQYLNMIRKKYAQATSSKAGISEIDRDPDDRPYFLWGEPLKPLLKALWSAFEEPATGRVNKDLREIIRGLQYALTNKRCFAAPSSEQDVHDRAEMVLKCVFPDLIENPVLTKQIKNFAPDTGIPSHGTLIEYKFVDDPGKVGPISDEILADTWGYHSAEWRQFVYVIYETQRFKSQHDWQTHLRQCGTADNTDVIVICGEPPARKDLGKGHQITRRRQKSGIRKKSS